MALHELDKYESCLYEPGTGPKQYLLMTDFLQRRYGAAPAEARYDNYFRIEAAALRNRWDDASDVRVRKVGLYFQRSNLYLRAWTIDGGEPQSDPTRDPVWFMAGWTPDEFAGGGPLTLLPAGGRGYLGSPPGSRSSPYINLAYPKNDVPTERLSKDAFYNCVNTLYEYLHRLRKIKQGNRTPSTAELETDAAKTEKSLHLLARMTAEMARFDPYGKYFSGKWAEGIPQTARPRSEYEWGRDKAKQMPPLCDIVKKWNDYSRKAQGGDSRVDYDGVAVTPEMANEAMGRNGARWRAGS